MTARDDELRELAAAWALGSLSPEEAREFEALMARSPELALSGDASEATMPTVVRTAITEHRISTLPTQASTRLRARNAGLMRRTARR